MSDKLKRLRRLTSYADNASEEEKTDVDPQFDKMFKSRMYWYLQ